MEVKYSVSRKEIWNWYWDSWRSGIKWQHLFIFILITLIFVAFDYNHITPFTFIKASVVFLCTFAFMVAYPQIMYKPQTRVLTVLDNGINIKVAKYDKVIPWSKVSTVDMNNDFISIAHKNNALLIPSRAFSSKIAMQEFYEYTNDIFAKAKNT